MPTSLSADSLQRLLSRRDLTNPRQGEHALQTLARDALTATGEALQLPVRLHRSLGVARDGEGVPRLQTVATDSLQELLDLLRDEGASDIPMLACLGPVHAGQQDGALRLRGHRLALWVQAAGEALLPTLVRQVARGVLPDAGMRLLPEPGTTFDRGFRMDVHGGDGWMAVATCGYLKLDGQEFTGIVMELEPVLAVRKGLPDPSLVHSPDQRVQAQLLDLQPWKPLEPAEPDVSRPVRPAG